MLSRCQNEAASKQSQYSRVGRKKWRAAGGCIYIDCKYLTVIHSLSEEYIARRTKYGIPSGSFLMYQLWFSWWRHQMETFSASLALCVGNSPVTGEFPTQMPVTQSFDVFFDLRPNKRLSEQSWGRWFDTPSHSLWRHCNVTCHYWLFWDIDCVIVYFFTHVCQCVFYVTTTDAYMMHNIIVNHIP